MVITIKAALAFSLWTATAAGALARTFGGDESMNVWVFLFGALAATVSAALIIDYVALTSATSLVNRVREERETTIEETLKALRRDQKAMEDRILSRVQSVNEAAMRRVAVQVARAVSEDRATPIR